ncbi:MAG: single-stranded-DNA-specific exonuclease RecJ [Proteobacteria bacterium]|nr:single-stranded-DNA-specific exonuclease RecJ [Pseudomonadota bacterium]MDA1072470.1 single-stranded-DNA-specific exonuclease RecJ [Pseudomonadota bacterium]
MAATTLGVERSIGGRRWRNRLDDDRLALALAQRLDLPEIVARVLAARGIDADRAGDFLNPTLRALLPDPSVMAGMDEAVARLADAVVAGETIGIFGDYDVDGATSSALLVRFFGALGVPAVVHIPDRQKEGYGPNAPALLALRERGARLVVTVDCGISAFEPLRLAHEAGIEVIVFDHHTAEAALPAARAVVNPNRLDDSSGLGQLAAVGVTFMAVVALNRELRRRGHYATRAEPQLMAWLDLVALGTICDSVPLTGLNRALALQGFKAMASRGNRGLAALADIARITEAPGAYHAGFILGPRINAGGRVAEPDLGVRLLTTEDGDVATGLALRLDALNIERQTIEKGVLEAALRQAEAQADASCIVVADPGWHPGVIGIVASRVVERFNRPAFVVALAGGIGKGSGRSLAGVDLGAAVTAARQAGLLVNGGGHPMAAGITVEEGRLAEVAAFLCERLARAVSERPVLPELGIDGSLAVGAANVALLSAIERLGPFGVGNAEPRFVVSGARVVRADVVGADHVRCILAGGDGARLKAIAFRAAGEPLGQALTAGTGRELHLAGKLRMDRWQGAERAQLIIEDAAPAQ